MDTELATPEAQSLVIGYLKTSLLDIDAFVSSSKPRGDEVGPIPELVVTVRREGGGALDSHRDSPGIGVYSWAPTEAKAAALAMRVSERMRQMPITEHGVAKVVEESLYSAPDPESKEPRWYGSYTLTTYQI